VGSVHFKLERRRNDGSETFWSIQPEGGFSMSGEVREEIREPLGSSRRDFLRLLSAVGLGAAAGSLEQFFPPQAIAAGTLTLTFFGQTGGNNTGRELVHRAIFRKFENTHPGIKVIDQYFPWEELQRKLSVAIAGNNPPDVIYADAPLLPSYAHAGVIRPIGEYFTKEELADIVPQSLEDATYRGQFYGPPESQSAQALFYNAEWFDKAGIKAPQRLSDGWPWSKWLEVLKEFTKTTNGRVVVYGLERVQPPNLYTDGPMIRSAGATRQSNTFKAISPDGLHTQGYLDTDEAIEGFQFFEDLFQKHKVAPVAPVQDMLATGKAAVAFGSESIIGNLKRNYKSFAYGIAPLPFLKTPLSHTGSLHYTVATKTKHPAEAAALVQFMGNGPNSLSMFEFLQQVPGSKYALAHADAYKTYPRKLLKDTLEQWGVIRPKTVGYQELDLGVSTALADLTTGVGDVSARIKQMTRGIDAQLAKYK
jgi:ABC-type glycerol-3-phosphate transport system substrate-binding protein